MNGAVEFLQRRLEEKEAMLAKAKSRCQAEDILIAIDGIKSAILSFTEQVQVAQVA